MVKDFKEAIKQGKQAEQPATPLATPTQEQAVQPQEEVKVVPIASSGVNVTPEKVNDIFEKQRESLTEVKKDGYDGIFQQIQANDNATAKQKMAEIEEKRRNRARIFNAIGDGVAALSNLYFASQGAPSVKYDPRGSLSARAQERWDKMDLLRNEEEQKQYLREKQKREDEAQDAFRQAQIEHWARQDYNTANYQSRKLAQDKENAEKKREDEVSRHHENLENKKEIEEKRQAGQTERTKIQQAGANYRAMQKQSGGSSNSANSIPIGEDEFVDLTKAEWNDERISNVFSALPSNLQEEAKSKYGTKDSFGMVKPLTKAQMRQALGEYLSHPDAEEARNRVRAKKSSNATTGEDNVPPSRRKKNNDNVPPSRR